MCTKLHRKKQGIYKKKKQKNTKPDINSIFLTSHDFNFLSGVCDEPAVFRATLEISDFT